MACEIVWTKRAEKSFFRVIDYLKEEWTENEVKHFVQRTDDIIERIRRQPETFRRATSTGVHEALITKHNLLIYRVTEKKATLLKIWDTRQNPRKKGF